jgi:hypothetical protein
MHNIYCIGQCVDIDAVSEGLQVMHVHPKGSSKGTFVISISSIVLTLCVETQVQAILPEISNVQTAHLPRVIEVHTHHPVVSEVHTHHPVVSEVHTHFLEVKRLHAPLPMVDEVQIYLLRSLKFLPQDSRMRRVLKPPPRDSKVSQHTGAPPRLHCTLT